MAELTIYSMEELTLAIDAMIPRLKRSSREESVGRYGEDEMFFYRFWNVNDHSEISFWPWIPDDRSPHEYDSLMQERNQITFKPKYGGDRIQVESITHFRTERGARGYCWFWLPEGCAQFYEECRGSFAARWDFSSEQITAIIPQMNFSNPVKFLYVTNGDAPSSLVLDFDPKEIVQFYERHYGNKKIEDGLIKMGSWEYPIKENLAQKINEMVNLERGLASFINTINNR